MTITVRICLFIGAFVIGIYLDFGAWYLELSVAESVELITCLRIITITKRI